MTSLAGDRDDNSRDEKPTGSVEHVERTETSDALDDMKDGELLAADIRPAAERSLVRRMDMRLLPTIVLIFIMNYIDVSSLLHLNLSFLTFASKRTAVTAARLKGLETDLRLTGKAFLVMRRSNLTVVRRYAVRHCACRALCVIRSRSNSVQYDPQSHFSVCLCPFVLR